MKTIEINFECYVAIGLGVAIMSISGDENDCIKHDIENVGPEEWLSHTFADIPKAHGVYKMVGSVTLGEDFADYAGCVLFDLDGKPAV